MIRSLYAVPAMFCLTAALVTAQAPAGDKPATNPPGAQQPTTPKPSSPSTSSAASAGKVTYTGCVKPGTSADSWVLENAETQRAGASTPSSVGTSGTSKMTLNLDPEASVNLKPHANHKVEVTGSLKPGSSAGAAGAGGAAGKSTSGAASSASGQTFNVESLKMVSATCP